MNENLEKIRKAMKIRDTEKATLIITPLIKNITDIDEEMSNGMTAF